MPTGLITTVFLTHRLGSAGYGLYALVVTLIAWIEWGIASLFSRTTIKYISEARDWRLIGVSLIQLHLLVSVGVTVLLWLLSPYIARLLHEPILASYILWFALDIPLFRVTYAYRNILIDLGSFRRRALISVSRYLIRLLLIVLPVDLGFSLPGAILGNIGASLVEFFIGYLYVRPSLFGRSNLPTWKLWENAIPLFLSALSVSLYNRVDLFILKLSM